MLSFFPAKFSMGHIFHGKLVKNRQIFSADKIFCPPGQVILFARQYSCPCFVLIFLSGFGTGQKSFPFLYGKFLPFCRWQSFPWVEFCFPGPSVPGGRVFSGASSPHQVFSSKNSTAHGTLARKTQPIENEFFMDLCGSHTSFSRRVFCGSSFFRGSPIAALWQNPNVLKNLMGNPLWQNLIRQWPLWQNWWAGQATRSEKQVTHSGKTWKGNPITRTRSGKTKNIDEQPATCWPLWQNSQHCGVLDC